jgi:hypothetical protein
MVRVEAIEELVGHDEGGLGIWENTECLSNGREQMYTIEDMIEILKFAKERYGNLGVVIAERDTTIAGSISGIFLHKVLSHLGEKDENYLAIC